jgi:hypothetical protein
MKMRVTHRFDADVATVFALVTDEQFLRRKYDAQGATDVEITRAESPDGGLHLEIRRRVTLDLPGFAKRVLQPTNTLVHVERWQAVDENGRRVCDYHVDVQGVPSRIEGVLTLSPDGAATRQDTEAEVRVSVPLVGGRLERFAADNGRRLLDDEAEFTRAELAAGGAATRGF